MEALLTLITHQVILRVLDFILGGKGGEAGAVSGCEWLIWLMKNVCRECVHVRLHKSHGLWRFNVSLCWVGF